MPHISCTHISHTSTYHARAYQIYTHIMHSAIYQGSIIHTYNNHLSFVDIKLHTKKDILHTNHGPNIAKRSAQACIHKFKLNYSLF